MSSRIAAAKAFLDAGNAARARSEIETALRDNPHNAAARDVYCWVLREQEQWDALEATAREWLSWDPASARAYAHLLIRLKVGRRSKDAKKLREQYLKAITDPDGLKMLDSVYQVCFGDAADAYSRLSTEAAASGDFKSSFQFASKAALFRANLSEAVTEAEFARRTGDNSAKNFERLSMLSFRLLRFSKCREYARLALQADPTSTLPRELIVLSWISYFPPFVMGNALVYLFNWIGRMNTFLVVAGSYLLGPFLLVFAYWVLTVIAAVLYLPPGVVIGMALAYFAYVAFFIGTVSRLLFRSAMKSVQLKDY